MTIKMSIEVFNPEAVIQLMDDTKAKEMAMVFANPAMEEFAEANKKIVAEFAMAVEPCSFTGASQSADYMETMLHLKRLIGLWDGVILFSKNSRQALADEATAQDEANRA